jgi:hypothetical protein
MAKEIKHLRGAIHLKQVNLSSHGFFATVVARVILFHVEETCENHNLFHFRKTALTSQTS